MNHFSIDLPVPQSKRRSTRFLAVVEALGVRQLMASGVTVTPLPLTSEKTGVPLFFSEPPTYDILSPVGTPVPLLSLSTPTGPPSPMGYSGTVDWGDGSPIDTASFAIGIVGVYLPTAKKVLLVSGPDHTYQSPGSFTVNISVVGPGDPAATVYQNPIAVNAPGFSLAGQLNPASDSGFSNADGVTNINTPNFFGTTQPGATVVIYATTANNLLDAKTLPVGLGVANAAGNWSINTIPFFDGKYSITATATGKFGVTVSAGLTTAGTTSTNFFYGEPSLNNRLQIDTIGPKIVAFQLVNAKKGIFQVGFNDPYGLLVGPLTDPNNYVVGRPTPTPRNGQTFPVATLTSSTVPFGVPLPYTTYLDLVTGTVSTGKPLITQNGVYSFTIRSARIISLSGSPLDGEYNGKFPAGNGIPGGNFQVRVNVRNGKPSGPIAVAPVKVTTHPVKAKVKAVARHHA